MENLNHIGKKEDRALDTEYEVFGKVQIGFTVYTSLKCLKILQ